VSGASLIVEQAGQRGSRTLDIALGIDKAGGLVRDHLGQCAHIGHDHGLFHRQRFERLHRRDHLAHRPGLARERADVDPGVPVLDLFVGHAAGHDQPVGKAAVLRDGGNRLADRAEGNSLVRRGLGQVVGPVFRRAFQTVCLIGGGIGCVSG
jgi:hypothetical protein